jgi:RNA polymerase I-associated factor PAF67
VGEYGSKPLYKMLGYFSIIGLLRVHTLLGDYTLALRVMDNIELNQKVSNCLIHSENKLIILAGVLHSCHCVSCGNLLLCWLLLLGIT